MNCKLKKKWIELEKEHTSSDATAKRIVKEHVKEWGCGYYPALIKMEKRLKRK